MNDSENIEEYETVQLQEVSPSIIDYSNYFENIQTMLILILAGIVALGCFLGWVGARRE